MHVSNAPILALAIVMLLWGELVVDFAERGLIEMATTVTGVIPTR